MSTYYRNGHRRNANRSSGSGSRWMPLRYDGICKVCGESIPAGETAYWDSVAKTTTCYKIDCAEADDLTERVERWARNPDGKITRSAYRVTSGSPVHPNAVKDTGKRIVTTRFNSGAVVYQNARGRCEDAPCCGCCS
jgi:hypothetical protein